MNTQQLADTYQMAVPNLNSVSSIVLSLVGTLFTIFMVTKVVAAWARKDWGALVMEAAAGAVVAFFVFAPATATAVLTSLGVGVFGS
jgi:hypothetical protein